MRMIRRTLAASALALPLIVGAAGIASADTYPDHDGGAHYTNTSTSAGPDGAASDSTSSHANDWGSTYDHQATWAGAHGAGTASTHSGAHDWDNDWDCDWGYYHHSSHDWNDDDDDGGLLDVLGR
jgi:hypothetical protein